jgi:hypothetical protein
MISPSDAGVLVACAIGGIVFGIIQVVRRQRRLQREHEERLKKFRDRAMRSPNA